MLHSGRKNVSTFLKCSFPETVQETEIKGWQTNVAEETSRQPNVQSVAQILLAAFSQIYKNPT